MLPVFSCGFRCELVSRLGSGGWGSALSLLSPHSFPIPTDWSSFYPLRFRKRETGTGNGRGVVSGWCGGGRIAGGTPYYFYTLNFKLPTILSVT